MVILQFGAKHVFDNFFNKLSCHNTDNTAQSSQQLRIIFDN